MNKNKSFDFSKSFKYFDLLEKEIDLTIIKKSILK